jgi:hypothetical protein
LRSRTVERMPTPGFRPAVRRILHDFEPIGCEEKKSLLFNTLRSNMVSSRRQTPLPILPMTPRWREMDSNYRSPVSGETP